ncbi:hypothetical protein OFO03_07265 [Campylobacter sp. JMF_02 ED1]|uniref:hypothetical protein n=1 Tax=unclassified Campylobacter TaxID=2593542 RepID=UPI0022E9B363|nr:MULTISPECIES: hypothetical protein [unclassified Campylobacter]MDA3050267.1 hypothetical protein [Campylobacter sp. JMF_15 NE4]MDA3051698.1 hypothetical protein [Campylobacter sp. JMF_02 ED1]
MIYQAYKTNNELKLKFKLLNLSFLSLFLYFMIFQNYINAINLHASNLKSNNANITTNSHTEFTNKSGILTATITDKGKITEAQIL